MIQDKHRRTILVVEDNDVMRKALLETLKVLEYSTLEAANGSEALELIEGIECPGAPPGTCRVSLIMSDLTMPEMGGQELFLTLKKKEIDIPLIMLTGYTVTNELDELCKQGLSGWLQKPADIHQIDALLRKVLA